jgi:hypothetical protein
MDQSTLLKFWHSFNVSPLLECPQFPEKYLKHLLKHKEVHLSSHQVSALGGTYGPHCSYLILAQSI